MRRVLLSCIVAACAAHVEAQVARPTATNAAQKRTDLAIAPQAAPQVDLVIRDGRVWLTSRQASLGQILREYARVGGTEIGNLERLSAVPVTIQLAGVSERQALDLLLRSAGGFVTVPRRVAAPGAPAASEFARILIVPATSNATPAASTASAVPAQTVFPVSAAPNHQPVSSIPVAPGVRRLLGADGQPVPDDQDDVPPGPPPAAVPTASPTPAQQPPVAKPRRPGGNRD